MEIKHEANLTQLNLKGILIHVMHEKASRNHLEPYFCLYRTLTSSTVMFKKHSISSIVTCFFTAATR